MANGSSRSGFGGITRAALVLVVASATWGLLWQIGSSAEAADQVDVTPDGPTYVAIGDDIPTYTATCSCGENCDVTYGDVSFLYCPSFWPVAEDPASSRTLDGTADTAGTWTVSAKCPEDGAHGSDSSELNVIEVTDIDVLNNTATDISPVVGFTPDRTDICAAIKPMTGDAGYVMLQAEIYPDVAEGLVASLITWTGGEAVAGHPLQRKVSRAAWAKHTVKAEIGTSDYTMLVYIIGATPSGYSPANGQAGNHFADNEKGYPNGTGVFKVWNAANGTWHHYCEVEFAVKPDVLVTDANGKIFKKSEIKWDVSRERRTMFWRHTAAGWAITESSTGWVNDDSHDGEEDNNPWNGNGHLYGNDGPGGTPPGDAHVFKDNMREWARVGLGAAASSHGDRCSEYKPWRCFGSVKKVGAAWQKDNTYDNEIPPGHAFWGNTPINPLNITTATLPNGYEYTDYDQTLASANGTAPVAWSIDSGSLPAGLTLNAATGKISGMPTVPGTYAFTVEAQDSSTPAQADLQTLTLVIEEE